MGEQANGNAGFRLVRCVMETMFSVAGMQGISGWTKMIMKMGVTAVCHDKSQTDLFCQYSGFFNSLCVWILF